ncbi:phenylacetate--CoA ligase family protein [Nocardia transvalensis]|uniref:phenylacetate--CoA ligase family protein n=1 Tax=Nocardia transvalensis TaxID=37333 RepID=UPI0018959363|nr:AMP-binding protein [Nocardia transvalensis]MBF6331836.1 phenylacetate--CoA ligase family protein [Nocardia transvalensis]
MYELLNADTERFSRETLSRHLAFERAEWNAASLRLHQTAAVRRTLEHVTTGSKFYKHHLSLALDRHPVNEVTLESLETFPFTTKNDLREHGLEVLSKPISEAWIFYETTGTTGKATPCPRDNVDSTVSNTALTVNYASILRRHSRKHVVGVMGPTELHSTGDAFGEVFRNLGHCVVKMWPHSPVVGYQRALEVMAEIGVTALVCTPGMAMALAREAIESGYSISDFDLDFIMVVGELVTPALLSNIESVWSTTVYNCMYASQEASIMAAVRDDGQLRTVPLNNYYEIVDPDSGRRVLPDKAGERVGELVVTHLFQGCKPLIRYRTGDMVRLRPSGEGARYPSDIMTPLGRVRDVTEIGGTAFTAYALEQVVLEGIHGCYGYQIVIDSAVEAQGDCVQVVFEFLDDRVTEAFDVQACAARIGEALGASTSVKVGAIGTIATTGAMVSWKASRVHDKRAAEDPERCAALAIALQRDGAR